MQKRVSFNNKYCEWCRGTFIHARGRQSDMCPICWTRYKTYLETKKQLIAAQRDVDEVSKYLETLTNYYREQAKQGCRVPEELMKGRRVE